LFTPHCLIHAILHEEDCELLIKSIKSNQSAFSAHTALQNVPKSLATTAQLRVPTGKLTNDAPQDPLLGPGRKKAKSGREKEGKVQESS